MEIDISIVCPVYNEEDMIHLFMDALFTVINDIDRSFEIVFVNDGSSDNSLDVLIKEKKIRKNIRIINLSRNFGKEAALTAGLDHAAGKAIIPIDADLQDPPGLIKELIARWEDGYDVVLAKRGDRSTDNFAKRNTAHLFYKIHNRVSRIKIPDNVGDYRLITRKVASAIHKLPENQRFMKGIFAWVGFKTAVVEYKRGPRKAGKTNFNSLKLVDFALDGITGFSTIPLRIWLFSGTLISMTAFFYGSYIFFRTILYGIDLPGYASLLTTILFLGGMQMIGIGVIGEYIGKMYMEAKRRPPYIIEGMY